ncbi:MAG TPA: tetratricopeptide repeat protein, partial [Planctomycetota bacterium]|nr:tetratricopeptide repeat protein [Planctomycetota bacterium]
GDAAGGIEDANHAQELDGDEPAVLYATAQILGTAPGARVEPVADRRRNVEARRLLGEALAREPELSEALVLDQTLALYAGDPAAAVERGERALALQPENLGVLANHALALARTSRTDEANKALERAVLLAPENTAILYLRGKFRVELLHDWQGAVADLTRVLAEDSAPADAWLERGIALCNLGQFQAGIADLDQGERVAPSNAPWLANLRAARDEARARSAR